MRNEISVLKCMKKGKLSSRAIIAQFRETRDYDYSMWSKSRRDFFAVLFTRRFSVLFPSEAIIGHILCDHSTSCYQAYLSISVWLLPAQNNVRLFACFPVNIRDLTDEHCQFVS